MAGSWVGDSIEEFKKAPPVGKVAIVLAFVAVVGIGWYEYSKNKSSSSGVSGASSPSTDLSGAGANVYPTVPGGNTGQVPVLPGGLQPLFDSLGNLIGFQPIPPGTTTTTPTPGPTPTPKPTKPPKKTRKDIDTSGKGHSEPINRPMGGRLPQQPGPSIQPVSGKDWAYAGRVQPPTGTHRGERPGPGQASRPVPAQPVRRRV